MHTLSLALGPEQTDMLTPFNFSSTTTLWTPDQIVLPYPSFKRNACF